MEGCSLEAIEWLRVSVEDGVLPLEDDIFYLGIHEVQVGKKTEKYIFITHKPTGESRSIGLNELGEKRLKYFIKERIGYAD